MSTFREKYLAIATALLSSMYYASGFGASAFVKAIEDGQTDLNFRLRYENVDQRSNDGATALTLLSRFTYNTAEYKRFSARIAIDDVTELGAVNYRTASNDSSNPSKSIIADPEGTEVNQALLAYRFSNNTAKYGRQRIKLDNERHVGGVSFRQNEQTYDAFSLTLPGREQSTLYAAYVTNVNRIFGEDNVIGDHAQNGTLLINASRSLTKHGMFVFYYYGIDNKDVTNFSTNTYGARWEAKAGDTFKYNLEYARQEDSDDNAREYSAPYYLIEGAALIDDTSITVGYEVLGADGSDGEFITPLATLHKFQGFTDIFLNNGAGNIAGGIRDAYASISRDIYGVKASAFFHQFKPDNKRVSGTKKYGQEYAFALNKKFGAFGLDLKYAEFDARGFGDDTKKAWLTMTAGF